MLGCKHGVVPLVSGGVLLKSPLEIEGHKRAQFGRIGGTFYHTGAALSRPNTLVFMGSIEPKQNQLRVSLWNHRCGLG